MEKQLHSLTIDKEFRDLIPPLTADERKQLEANIIKDGCRDALVVWTETIVDGHNRYEICHRCNVPFDIMQKDFADREAVKEWIILNQFGRRNLKPFQRVELAEQYRPILEKRAKDRQLQGKRQEEDLPAIPGEGVRRKKDGETNVQLAKLAGVGSGSILKGRKVVESASEDEKQALREGKTTINKVYTDIRQREAPHGCHDCASRTMLAIAYYLQSGGSSKIIQRRRKPAEAKERTDIILQSHNQDT